MSSEKKQVGAIALRLNPAQKARFATLLDTMGCSASEAVRRLVDEAYERHAEGLSGTKTDVILSGTLALQHELKDLRSEIVNLKARSESSRAESARAVAEIAAMRQALLADIAATRAVVSKTYFDLRAIYEIHGKRVELDAVRERLVTEAANGGR